MGRKRRGRGRSRDCKDEGERIPLVTKHDSQPYTRMAEDQDQSQPDDAGPSTDSKEKLRLMVLGGDDALMNKACGTILRKRNKKTPFEFGKLEPMIAYPCGRQVSVLKTPFTWLQRLKSYWVFSRGVKAIRNDMEFCESLMFPGPHAFLLVHRDVKNSGRENYLLQALSEVFGTEVLDYCMVLFIDQAKHNDPKKNYCLKMCGRHHTLQNTDYSVNELFKKIEKMTEGKDSSFFIAHPECFRKASKYFQAEYKEKEDKLIKDLDDSKERERQLRDDRDNLHMQMEELKEQLENNLTDLRVKEDRLHEIEDLDRREKRPEDRSEIREREVRYRQHLQTTEDPPSAVSKSKDRLLYEREGELKSRDYSQSTGSLGICKPVRRNSKTEPLNMSSEHHHTTADPSPAETEGELKSRDDSQWIQKPVRRNSKDFNPPYMTS